MNHPVDKLFRDKLIQHTSVPTSRVWTQVDASWSRKSMLFYASRIAALLVMGLCVFISNPLYDTLNQTIVQTKPTIVKPTDVQPKETFSVAKNSHKPTQRIRKKINRMIPIPTDISTVDEISSEPLVPVTIQEAIAPLKIQPLIDHPIDYVSLPISDAHDVSIDPTIEIKPKKKWLKNLWETMLSYKNGDKPWTGISALKKNLIARHESHRTGYDYD